MSQTILIVDDEETIQENLGRILREEGYTVAHARAVHEARAIMDQRVFDLVLLDLNLPDGPGMDLLRTTRDAYPSPLVIVMTGFASVDSAVEALKLGAYDYIKKPFKADAIKLIVRLALETQGLRRRVDALNQETSRKVISELIGNAPPVEELRKQILQVAAHDDSTVLIMGESGTGKELTARAVHRHSPRKDGPFIDVNCASLPPTLLESELFGFEKGAFTDARSRKPGIFELAVGGTLFLDEIAEMDTALQAKLLRVLEQKTVRHLGGTRDIPVNVRVIAATNKELRAEVEQHRFREDLFYRINVVPLTVPPLRERQSDIPLLVDHYLGILNQRLSRNAHSVSSEAMEYLCRYPWPGNVRELKNILERILILYDPECIEVAHLPQETLSVKAAPTAAAQITLPQEGISLPTFLVSIEEQIVALAMERTGNNISQAARLLNIPRETLRYKLTRSGNGK